MSCSSGYMWDHTYVYEDKYLMSHPILQPLSWQVPLGRDIPYTPTLPSMHMYVVEVAFFELPKNATYIVEIFYFLVVALLSYLA